MGDISRGKEFGDYRNLAKHMEQRRAELRLRWRDIEQRADKSSNSIRKVMRGAARVTYEMERAIEAAYSWNEGSVRAALAGGEPTPLDIPAAIPVAQPPRELNAFMEKWSTRLPRPWFYELVADVGEVAKAAAEEGISGRPDHEE